jgi:hypothetical protein
MKALYVLGYQPLTYHMTNMNSVGQYQWNLALKDLSLMRYVSGTHTCKLFKHYDDEFLQYMHIAYTLYGLTMLFIKAAIIAQCIRILTPLGVRTTAYWIFQVLLWTHAVVYIANTFLEIFICDPRAKAWDYTIVDGKCLDIDAVHITSAAVNLISDIVLVAIPQLIIWRMQMPIRRRWAVSSVFLVGLL